MIHDEGVVQVIWLFIFAVLIMVFSCLLFRFILLYMIKKNICNLHTIFSNTRILQTNEEKRLCNALAKSLQWTFQDSNIHRIVPIHPQFIVAESLEGNVRNDPSDAVNHWPIFQIAVDGKILDPELLIATRPPEYQRILENSPQMLTADYFRNGVQSLGVNSSLDRHNDDSRNSFGSNSFSSFGGSQGHVPVDRPLFVNTSMSAQQRVDLYRRLSDPPKDNEPALTFSFRPY